MADKRADETLAKRFSPSRVKELSREKFIGLAQEHFPEKTIEPVHSEQQHQHIEWYNDFYRRVSGAFLHAELTANYDADGNRRIPDGAIRRQLQQVADCAAQLAQALTGNPRGVNSNDRVHGSLWFAMAAGMHSITMGGMPHKLPRTQFGIAVDDGLESARTLHDLATQAISTFDSNYSLKNEKDYYETAVIGGLGECWRWATGKDPTFSTPHQKYRHHLKQHMRRPKHISTAKGGRFVRFVQGYYKAARATSNDPEPPTGAAIAARWYEWRKLSSPPK